MPNPDNLSPRSPAARSHSPIIVASAAGCIAACTLLCACATPSTPARDSSHGPARTLSLADFTSQAGLAARQDPSPATPPLPPAPPHRPPLIIKAEAAPADTAPAANPPPSAVTAAELPDDTNAATVGPPSTLGHAQALGKSLLVDAKVGDINGRAVYASAFFDYGTANLSPLGPRLAAEAKTQPAARWRAFAREEISRGLRALIQDELLRAESLTMLTPEQKMGFLAYMGKIQDDLERQRGGSRAQADRNLRETQGISIDEWRRRREDEELVRIQLSERIFRRVNVTFRDIEARYDQQFERFHPPPRAVFRLAQVPKGREQDVAKFTGELASAPSFADAAKSELNINKRAEGGLEVRDIPEDPAKAEYFANPALNQAARTIKMGETLGPIELSASVAWLHLDRVQEGETSLYEAQLDLEDEITGQRRERELNRYITALAGKASITSVGAMVERLAQIAEARYFPRATGS